MRRLNPTSYFFIFILLAMATVVGVSLTYPYLEVKLLPVGIGSIVFILAVIGLSREVTAKAKAQPPTTAKGEPTEVETKNVLRGLSIVLGWMIALYLAVYLLGFFIAIALYMLVYLKVRRRSWLVAIVCAAVTAAAIYGGFEVLMKANLYKGLIWGGH